MKRELLTLSFALALLATAAPAVAQHAVGVASGGQTATQDYATGWSAKKTLLGKIVYNESNQKVGAINDLIIGPDGTISYVIVAAGGFVGEKRHDVAIDVASLDSHNGKFYVEGATRENVKAIPKFEYAESL